MTPSFTANQRAFTANQRAQHTDAFRRLTSPEARKLAISARSDDAVSLDADQWTHGDPESASAFRTTLVYRGPSDGYAALVQSTTVSNQTRLQSVYLTYDGMERAVAAMQAILDAVRELDSQRGLCEIGECAHPEHDEAERHD